MFLNSMRMRVGLIAAGVVLAGAWMLCGGDLFPGSRPGVLIEFGADPDTFTGMDVEIDGQVVGKLQQFGQTTRTGFETAKGEHTVRVVHPDFDCPPVRVATEIPGMKVMLLLQHAETPGPGGRPALTLQQ